MINTKYINKEEAVKTSISGGRLHHTYRLPVQSIGTYEYNTSYGENYHTLAAIIFGTDEYWWVISDMNIPRNAFAITPDTAITLPTNIVKNSNGGKKFV